MNRILVLALCLLIAGTINAQETYSSSSGRRLNNYSIKKKKKEGFDIDRLVIGGSIGATFGNITDISFSPKVGYKITDNFAVGVGLGYEYYKFTDFYTYKLNIFSGSVWARYAIWRGLFAHAEFLQGVTTVTQPGVDQYGNVINVSEHHSAPSLLLGPGYRQPAGDNFSFNISLMYDVLQQDHYSPYSGNRIMPVIDVFWHF